MCAKVKWFLDFRSMMLTPSEPIFPTAILFERLLFTVMFSRSYPLCSGIGFGKFRHHPSGILYSRLAVPL